MQLIRKQLVLRSGLAAGSFFLAFASLHSQAPKEPFLDLTLPADLSWIKTRVGSGSSTVVEGMKITPPPLRMTIVAPASGEYRFGEQFDFEVTIENLDDRPFLMPWAGADELRRIQPDHPLRPPDFHHWYLHLALPSERTGEEHQGFLSGPSMYGASSAPGTLRGVAPGERVRVRSSSELTPDKFGYPSPAALPVEVEVRARLSMLRGRNRNHYLPLLSVNSLRLTIVGGVPPP